MDKTWQMLNACAPTRMEKRRIATQRGIRSEDVIYKECEDPERSGRTNPLDKLLHYFDSALILHPDAALKIVQFLEQRATLRIEAAAQPVRMSDLVAALQPSGEKEALDVVRAYSAALRQLLHAGTCEAASLLQEIEEAQRELKRAAVMLRAVIHSDLETVHAKA